MLVLGWHGGVKAREAEDFGVGYSSHDGAAVLLRDGRIVAAVEEERLNRVKHSNFFPARAIRYCLQEANVSLQDLDVIVTDCLQSVLDEFIIVETLNDPAEPVVDGLRWLAGTFAREFGCDVHAKLRCYRHHMAHLHGAFIPSNFREALVICLDGEGDGQSGLVARCGPDGVDVLRQLTAAQSLGDLYTKAISILGYRRFDEYKVMGLAPYGDPKVWAPVFGAMYELKPDGEYTIAPDDVKLASVIKAGMFDMVRRRGEPFTQQHMDFAAGLQHALETIALHVIRHFREATGLRNLCLSGGVAHNCTMNGKVLRSGMFERVFVQPAAHDAGNALGAALGVLRDAKVPIVPDPLPSLYLGPHIGENDAIERRLRAWAPLIDFAKVDDAPAVAARFIADGQVIGWAQGRSEFGPRALGNRSILADPRPAENKNIVNAMVKKRESYRPFAPSVTEEHLRDYFELPEGPDGLPFMIMVVPVRPEQRAVLQAVTHVDGTARAHSVSARSNPRFHALIEAFGRITGVPVVLNTSFNNNAEPIVDSVDDAVACFLTTGIHRLVIGDFVVSKADLPPGDPALLQLAPVVPLHRKLVRRMTAPGKPRYQIESTANSYFAEGAVVVSEDAFRLLLADEDLMPTLERCARLGIKDEEHLARLGSELFDLWQRRAIALRPAEPLLAPVR
jgi:carbamoyltransferase